ncbi:hypothetical protein Dimus_035969, partial [Dionaea muscipula]
SRFCPIVFVSSCHLFFAFPPRLPPVLSSLWSRPIIVGEARLRRPGHEDEEVVSKVERIGSVHTRFRMSVRRNRTWYHRFLLKMVNQAKSEDGELRERLGCRRSSRISPSNPSSFSDLGEGKAFGLTTTVKVDSMGVPADDPRRCRDSDPRCAADLEQGLPLSPIVEEVGVDMGKIRNLELSGMEMMGLIESEIRNMEWSLGWGEFRHHG